ncbi:MAG: caspase family protein [Treponema sp.]|nr:caspase family protein [Treponema sp.]
MKKFCLVALCFWATVAWAKPELVVQEGNDGGVKYLKYSNDGKFIMAATMHEAKIYERKTGILVKSFSLGEFKDFSPDVKYIVSIDHDDRRIFLTNIETRKKIAIGEENDEISKTYSFSPDSKYLAAPNTDYIDIYDVETHKKNIILQKSGYYFHSQIAWSADCRYLSILASCKKDQTPSVNLVYDMKQNKIIKVCDGCKGKYALYLTAISPDATYFAYANSTEIYIESVFDSKISKKKFLMSKEYGDKPRGLIFSHDGKKVYALKEMQFVEYDVENEKMYNQNRNFSAFSIAFSPYNADEIAIGAYQNIEIRCMNSLKQKEKISGVSHWGCIYQNTAKEVFFVSDAAGEETALFAQDFSKMPQSENLTKDVAASGLAFTEVGLYYSDYENKKIVLRDIESGQEKTILHKVAAEKIIGSPDGSLLAIYDNEKKETYVYDVKKKKKMHVFGVETGFTIMFSKFSIFDSYIFFYGNDGSQMVYDVKQNKTVLIEKNINWASFSFDEKYFAFYKDAGDYGNEKVYIYSTDNWRVVKTLETRDACFFYPFFSLNNRYVGMHEVDVNTGEIFISVYSVSAWGLIKKIPVSEVEVVCFFNEDCSKIITLGGAGIVHCYSVETGELLTSTMGDANGDWLTYTPEGYFNGSDGGISKFVHLVDGMKVSELGQYAQVLYRPDLVAAKLQGKDISNEAKGVSFSELVVTGEPPLVKFVDTPSTSASRDVTVNFTVQDQGGGIGSVYIKLNGKAIQLAEGSRKLSLEGGAANSANKQGAASFLYSQPVTLQNGDNAIEAYATNSAGKIESLHAATKISWQGKSDKPNLYVLSVGVNKYRDKSLWLQYSVADAEAVSKTFGGQKKSLYQNIYTHELFDGDVTKEGLAAQFAELAPKVKADDVFILFIVGHGTTSQKTGDYYFIPSNFRYTDADAIISQGVSKDDILKYMSSIKAGKTLIMLDTCNSGAFVSDKSMRGFVEKSAIERLVRSTGQAVLTAASDEQAAMEGYNGHGIFTYVLLEALNGKADRNKDGYLTLNELASYIEEQVPELSYKKWGYEQVPMKELRKQDFPLVGK